MTPALAAAVAALRALPRNTDHGYWIEHFAMNDDMDEVRQRLRDAALATLAQSTRERRETTEEEWHAVQACAAAALKVSR